NFNLTTVGKRIATIYCKTDPQFKLNYEYLVVADLNADFTDGDGTENNPYLISTTEQWQKISKTEDAKVDGATKTYYKLTNNIDFNADGGNKSIGWVKNADIDLGGFAISGIKTYLVNCAEIIAIRNGSVFLGGNASLVRTNGALYPVVAKKAESKFIDLNVYGEVLTRDTYYGVFICYTARPQGQAIATNCTFTNVNSYVTVHSIGQYASNLIGYASECKITLTTTNGQPTVRLWNNIQAIKTNMIAINGIWAIAHRVQFSGDGVNFGKTPTSSDGNIEPTIKQANLDAVGAKVDFTGNKLTDVASLLDADAQTAYNNTLSNLPFNSEIKFMHTNKDIVSYSVSLSVTTHSFNSKDNEYKGAYPVMIFNENINASLFALNYEFNTGFKKLKMYEKLDASLGNQYLTTDTLKEGLPLGSTFGLVTLNNADNAKAYYFDGCGEYRLIQGAKVTTTFNLEVWITVYGYNVLGDLISYASGFYTLPYSV
ncbi:MAG: hypothetical protein RR207_02150, partial [Clostridia bacterium]